MIAHRRTLRALIALILLPALLAAMALWSLGDRGADTDRIAAAVVNLDEPVTTGTGDQQQTIAAGRLLAAGLTSPSKDADTGGMRLDWQLTDAADARSGLDDGTYDAVVTIPEDFSQTVAGLTRNEAQQASFSVRSAEGSGALLGRLSDDVSRIAGAELGHRITGTYLEGLYGQTAQLGVRLGRAADAAGRIGDGASTLTTGADTLAQGADDLGTGVDALASGADDLRQGSEQASAGAGELTTGLERLSGGAQELASAAGRLARGATALDAGAGRLGEGADTLASGTSDLGTGLATLDHAVAPLPTRAGRLADGAGVVSQGVAGWARVLRGWQQACAADPTMTRYAALCAGTTQAVGADGATADQLTGGAAAVASGARQLADAAPALVQGVSDAADGAARLHAGAARLAAGADRLATGAGRVADGAGQIGAGAGRLADGAGSASTGAARLATGTGELAGGAGRLAAGATRAADGAGSLASGADRLSSGADRLGSGSGDLAEGLRSGVEALPSMTSAEQQRLAGAVAEPVAVRTDVTEAGDATRVGIAPAVLALVLWLGAALVYLLRPALPPARLEAPGLPWRVALAGWRPGLLAGVVQAVLLVPVLVLFDVTLAHVGLLVPVLVLAGAVFAALVQGIVGLLGAARGRATVLVLLALQALLLDGLLPIDAAPAAVRMLHGLLPVPVAADLVRTALTGRGAAVAGLLLLTAWGVVGLVLATRAARRAATVTPDDLGAHAEQGSEPRVDALSGC
ncbi:hypothetical protein [Nocardioides sp. T2.26MG-1]|uniref:hypothetical protein n=1 Tax=Nocardioides sp. T2.26MG-1 TaxID=3041166 RepID=UPI0025418D5D|nr:hypothetical protein [Nocardioides sp. T2.26MG-1]